MHLAKLQVPQGGAINKPNTRGESSHSRKSSWPSLVERSATFMVLTALLLIWSTPNESLKPKALRHAVTLAVPQNISMTTGWFGSLRPQSASLGLFALLELLSCEGKSVSNDEASGCDDECTTSECLAKDGIFSDLFVASSNPLCGDEEETP